MPGCYPLAKLVPSRGVTVSCYARDFLRPQRLGVSIRRVSGCSVPVTAELRQCLRLGTSFSDICRP